MIAVTYDAVKIVGSLQNGQLPDNFLLRPSKMPWNMRVCVSFSIASMMNTWYLRTYIDFSTSFSSFWIDVKGLSWD